MTESLFSAQAWLWIYAIGLLVLGYVMILLEIFVIPGFNIFGIGGFATICLGTYFAFARLGTPAAILVGLAGLAGTAALIWLLVRNSAWNRLVLRKKTDRASGYTSAPASLDNLVSSTGVALTPLRPAGRAQFDEQVVDVVTEGDFIEPGDPVEVLSVHGNRIVVHSFDATGVDNDHQ
jgi:membrane-bound serine protease (ClpP class)